MKTTISALIGLLLVLGTPARALDKAPSPPAGDAMAAMMKKMAEAGAPGEAHARLKALEGKWTATVRSWMKPGEKPQESAGTSVFSFILGGRFLKQEFASEFNGQKFEGLGLAGYDNIRKEYVSVWLDTMSTGLFSASGQYDAASKTIKDQGSFSCPMTGEKEKWFRAEWKLPDGDVSGYSMFFKDEAGKEFKSMEIVYKRVK